VIGNDVVDLRDPETLPGARHARFDARVFAAGERSALERSGARDRLRWILWAAKESAFKVAQRREPDTSFVPTRFVVDLDASLRGCVRHADREYPVCVAVTGDCVHAVATEAPAAGAVRAGVAVTGDCVHAVATEAPAAGAVRAGVAVTGDCVHAVATEAPAAGAVRAGVAVCAAEGAAGASLPGSAVRDLAAAGIAPLLGVERQALRFARRGRVPELQLDPGVRSGWHSARRDSVEARLGAVRVSLSHHGRFVAYACWLPESGPGEMRS
jgi:phosphopantetheinyl transferase (holo-ACP synthase)